MHIEAELDDIHAERLMELQKHSNKPLSELIAEILAKAIDETTTQPDTEGRKIYRMFDEAGLVGCMEGDGQLSVNYKQHLWGNK